jgi:hypothetical protein
MPQLRQYYGAAVLQGLNERVEAYGGIERREIQQDEPLKRGSTNRVDFHDLALSLGISESLGWISL